MLRDFQDFNLVPTLTALENTTLACDYAGVRGPTARSASLDALGLVGLADRANLLRGINRERGVTVVVVTHDADVAAACDRVIRMRDGRVQEGAVQ